MYHLICNKSLVPEITLSQIKTQIQSTPFPFYNRNVKLKSGGKKVGGDLGKLILPHEPIFQARGLCEEWSAVIG